MKPRTAPDPFDGGRFTRPGRWPPTAAGGRVTGLSSGTGGRDTVMTTLHGTGLNRRVYFHDPSAPPASVVVPTVFVAARGGGGRLLLVRRCDSGCWELPGGRVDVGETAGEAAVRETAEEAGVRVVVTGLAGLFTDPGLVVRAVTGEVRQPFVLVFRARAVGGAPRGDLHETSDAAWVALGDLPGLPMEPFTRPWIDRALAVDEAPLLI